MKPSVAVASLWTLPVAIACAYSPGPMMSPWQAYPASCVSNSMMDDRGGMMMQPGSGPTWTSSVVLPTVNDAFSGPVGSETVTFSMWRVPCSGSKSALMGRVVRSHSGLPEPVFGTMFVSQGGYSHQAVRIARDANTMYSDMTGAPFMNGFDFVVENGADYQIDYSQGMQLSISGKPNVSMMIPAYDPTQYSTASMPMMMSGYMTGNWYDAAHGGEGAQVEVGATSSTGRYMTFAWYTFDAKGLPFWLFGMGSFNAGDRLVNVTMDYMSGGGFAGNFMGATNAPWGSVTVQFPDCHTMQFSYQSNAGLPTTMPHGSGSRTWTRLTSINGLECQ